MASIQSIASAITKTPVRRGGLKWGDRFFELPREIEVLINWPEGVFYWLPLEEAERRFDGRRHTRVRYR